MTTPHALGREVFVRRRDAVAAALGDARALIAAGAPRPRNYPANIYPFRASSHFVYLTGTQIAGACLLWDGGAWTLYAPEHGRDHALWDGPTPSLAELGETLGIATAARRTLDDGDLRGWATVAAPDLATATWQQSVVGHPVSPTDAPDRALAVALIEARLRHDELALAEIARAADATAAAFAAGMGATRAGVREWAVRAAMTGAVAGRGMGVSFNPIVSVRGEILHNEASDGWLAEGDLLLADFGAEADTGWAADVTRAWPVSGTFSSTQRDLYTVVLAAQEAAIARCVEGARYRDVHLSAARTIASGLVDLGVLVGDPDELVADGVAGLLFPHGVGHLLGLDVHDMEDLGDLAGYAPGRNRSEQFGLAFLRLDRDLEPNMAVTIEPGVYIVPAILDDPELGALAKGRLDRDQLAKFSDVRGIRIEDDVVIRAGGAPPEVLTGDIPKGIEEVEAALR